MFVAPPKLPAGHGAEDLADRRLAGQELRGRVRSDRVHRLAGTGGRTRCDSQP